MTIVNTLKSLFAAALVATVATALQPAANAEAGNNGKKFVAGLVIGAAVAAAIASNNNGPRSNTFSGGGRRPKVNKYGFTTEKVWNRPGCRRLQAKCSKGVGKACFRYEERCQIN